MELNDEENQIVLIKRDDVFKGKWIDDALSKMIE